jgi:hypothetical protein
MKQVMGHARFLLRRRPPQPVAALSAVAPALAAGSRSAAVRRLAVGIALTDLFARLGDFALASDQPWPPRRALHVHGPATLRS